MRLLPLLYLLCSIVTSVHAQAHDARVGALHILHPAAPASLPGQLSGVIYLGIDNEGTTADRLLSLSSPAAANVALHTMTMDGNTMKMREADVLSLPPGAAIRMGAGQPSHLMLSGLRQPLKAGQTIALTMVFERAGPLTVVVNVEPNGTSHSMPAMHPAHATPPAGQ